MNRKTYHLPFHIPLRRWFLRTTVGLLFRIGGRIRVTGFDNIPRGTPYVAAINHVSIYDPPLVLCLWPEVMEAIGATDVFDRPFQGELLRIYRTVPVHRGEIDRKLIDTMLSILQSGRPLMIAPEGGRSHGKGMRRAKPGIGYILDEAGVPVVPVGLVGTTDDFLKKALSFQRPCLELHVGKPFTLPPVEGRGEARRLARQRNTDFVMQHIAGLVPPDYRGFYADSAINPS